MTKLKMGDRVICIKDRHDGYFVNKIGHLTPAYVLCNYDFKFVIEDTNIFTHLNKDCFVLATPLAEVKIYSNFQVGDIIIYDSPAINHKSIYKIEKLDKIVHFTDGKRILVKLKVIKSMFHPQGYVGNFSLALDRVRKLTGLELALHME